MPNLQRTDRKTYNRVKPKKTWPIKIDDAAVSGTLLTLTFNQSVAIANDLVPQYLTDLPGAEPVSAVMPDATTLKITYSEAIDTAEELIIPFQDPAIRNAVGGFVADSTFPLAA